MDEEVGKSMVPSEYANFFTTAATSGGALIGLLFVAISLAPERTVLARAPIEARIVSGSTFTAMFNAFFISLGALLPDTNIGWFALPLSIIGILNSLKSGAYAAQPLAFLAKCAAQNRVDSARPLPLYHRVGMLYTTPLLTSKWIPHLLPGTQRSPHLLYGSDSGVGTVGCATNRVDGVAKSPL